MTTTESYEAFRVRMQAESPDPDLCAHAMPLRVRCIRCEDETSGQRPPQAKPSP